MSEITIKPSADLARSWSTLSGGFGPVAPLLDELYPQRGTSAGDQKIVDRLAAKMKKDPGLLCLDAEIDGKLAGVAFWQFMETPIAESLSELEKDWETIWPEGDERDFFQQIWQDFVRPRREVVMAAQKEGKKVLLLEYLAVDEDFRRRGVGEALVSWGLEKADAMGLDAVLESTVAGNKLYKRLGFEDVGAIDYKSVEPRFASREKMELVFMRRPPQSATSSA